MPPGSVICFQASENEGCACLDPDVSPSLAQVAGIPTSAHAENATTRQATTSPTVHRTQSEHINRFRLATNLLMNLKGLRVAVQRNTHGVRQIFIGTVPHQTRSAQDWSFRPAPRVSEVAKPHLRMLIAPA